MLGITTIAINMAGALSQIAFGERLKGAVGAVIAGMLVIYIMRAGVRNYVGRG